MSSTTDNLRKGDWTAKEIQMLIDPKDGQCKYYMYNNPNDNENEKD